MLLSSDKVAQGFMQLGLEKLQGWRLHSVFGQPLPWPDCSHGEKVFPCIQPEPFLFQSMSVASCPLSMLCCEEPDSIFLLTSPKVLGRAAGFPLKLCLLQAEEAQFLQPLLTEQAFQSPPSLGASAELTPVCRSLSCTGGPKICCSI